MCIKLPCTDERKDTGDHRYAHRYLWIGGAALQQREDITIIERERESKSPFMGVPM